MGKPKLLRVAAERANLEAVNAFVRDAAVQAGLDTRAVLQVELALDEAFSNVLDHAYGASESGDLEVRWSVEEGAFVLVLCDWGQTFDPAAVPQPNLEATLEERALGGLGLHFMRSLMDSVDYEFRRDGNCLRMTKDIPE